MTFTALSQRDARWGKLLLGFNTDPQYSIGNYGCLITCLAMATDLTPDVVNEKLKSVNGFEPGSGELVWSKVKEYLPLDFQTPQAYDNDKVKQQIQDNGFCVVWVDFDGKISTPNDMHWVLYIGNQQLIDSWTGTTKSTGWYPLVKGFAPCKKISSPVPVEPLPTWLKGLLSENGVDPSKAEGKVRETFDQAKRYVTAQDERDKALRDLAEARGDATKFEELNITASKEIDRLKTEIDDLKRSIADRDNQIASLDARVKALESQIDPQKVIVVTRDEYARLTAKKTLDKFTNWELMKEVFLRSFKKAR